MAVLAGVVALVLALVVASLYMRVENESPIDPVAVSFGAPAAKAEGVWAPNSLLQGAERLGEGKLKRAEDLALDPTGTFLYATTADGWVKKLFLRDGAVENWQFVGGRPLGLALARAREGGVIVCAAHHGLLQVTDEGVEVLTTEADGIKLLLVDGAAVNKEGLIYFTDASTKYTIDDHLNDHLEGRPNGRIVVYNPEDKSTQVLIKDLHFPNGIALSKDEDFFIFSETTIARLSKYYLKGEKMGTLEIINEELPGFPDNIHYNYDKNIFYVGIVGQRDFVSEFLWKQSFLKKLVAMLSPSIQAALDSSGKSARLLAMDEDGKPLKVYQDPTGKVVGFVTGAIEADGYLYFGGLRDDFVARFPV